MGAKKEDGERTVKRFDSPPSGRNGWQESLDNGIMQKRSENSFPSYDAYEGGGFFLLNGLGSTSFTQARRQLFLHGHFVSTSNLNLLPGRRLRSLDSLLINTIMAIFGSRTSVR
ncbi:unnamed protein product [Protopolystoma xenopodis]|uniref:Uncharacterized protein n=1 Tax=Protopolystoma xenopodis TaxID=117903 RepID=A0A3S4ZW95_9PLAT|nr:unnamed protein product [Protopolystoma xenopodis]